MINASSKGNKPPTFTSSIAFTKCMSFLFAIILRFRLSKVFRRNASGKTKRDLQQSSLRDCFNKTKCKWSLTLSQASQTPQKHCFKNAFDILHCSKGAKECTAWTPLRNENTWQITVYAAGSGQHTVLQDIEEVMNLPTSKNKDSD